MYAIIAEGGGQRLVRKDDVILIDLIEDGEAKPGKSITFDRVLCIGEGDGKAVAKIGAPFVSGATVTAEVIEGLAKGEKVFIIKYRRRKRYSRRTGHRQQYTKVKITAIKG
ncbi:MAG: 50S ribosomal protein L21 [Phycisphaerae bacterium]|nr:50S ribosomal protein L21 [Phycisphaerae bacterium]